MELQQNKDHFFCSKTLCGEECDDPNCTHQHIKTAAINLSQILEYNDFFDLQAFEEDGAKEVLRMKHNIDHSDFVKPILCSICYKIIDPEKSLHMACCHSFCCKECIENWKFHGFCPACGKEGKIEEINEQNKAEIDECNKAFKIFEYREEKNIVKDMIQ